MIASYHVGIPTNDACHFSDESIAIVGWIIPGKLVLRIGPILENRSKRVLLRIRIGGCSSDDPLPLPSRFTISIISICKYDNPTGGSAAVVYYAYVVPYERADRRIIRAWASIKKVSISSGVDKKLILICL